MRRLVDEVVAIEAIETEDGIGAGMEGVIEGDGLIRRVSDVQILVRGVLIDRGGDDHGRDEQADEDLERGGVDGPGEEVAAGGRAVKEIEEFAHRVQTNGLAGFFDRRSTKGGPPSQPKFKRF